MKLIRLIAIFGIALFSVACGSQKDSFNGVNSESFPETQVTLGGEISRYLSGDSAATVQHQNGSMKILDDLILQAQNIRETKSGSSWIAFLSDWENLRKNQFGANGMPVTPNADSLNNSEAIAIAQKWAELNIKLLKFSGEVRFGDVLEKSLYEMPIPALTDRLLKTVIYTHIEDQIFINLIGSSSVNHYHTTGGTIKLIQETDFPEKNEMTLKCECADTRYLEVFIRIPEWAVNPAVTHGNVKYVAHPGEYCQISRKWKDGDEFKIILKN